MTGDLNVNLAELEGYWREEEIATALTTSNIEDILDHFFRQRRPWCWYGRTLSMVWAGRKVRSRTDYILGIDRRIFNNVTVRDPQHNLEHYLILGCLRGAPLR